MLVCFLKITLSISQYMCQLTTYYFSIVYKITDINTLSIYR